jgi:hypothetical protein
MSSADSGDVEEADGGALSRRAKVRVGVAHEGGGRRHGELDPDDDARLLPLVLVPVLLRSSHSPLPLLHLTRHAHGSVVVGNGRRHTVLPTLPPSLADVVGVGALDLSHVLRWSEA